MSITAAAIAKKRITGTALAVVVVAGLSAYDAMPRAEDPGFTIRTALVTTIFPGASPERVEQLVTDKLEKRIQEMPEIDFLNSRSKPGVSLIYVNVKESYRTMRPIWDNLRRKVEAAVPDLPEGIVGPTVDDEFGDVFGTLIALTGDGFSYAELKEVADRSRDELLLIEEVAKVEIAGIQRERVFVEFSGARLAELGLSPGQLKSILESANIIFPGGQVFTDREQIVLEPSGSFESVEQLAQTVIRLPGTGLVQLGDVANVRRGYVDPPASMVTHQGHPALVLAVSLREGGNIITLGEEVRKTLARLRAAYPVGLEFDVLYFQPEFVQKKVDDFVMNLLQAIGIVIAVMLLFLGLRTGLVIASLIPMAMVAAFMVMGFLSIGLDQMSLAALIIALGMLVDNAIVMSESIMVQMGEGKGAVQAACDSAAELRIPLLTSSLTTAAAFLPIYLAESTTGEYTAPIFEVVTITLLCSWLLALTMTPLLCVLFLKVGADASGESFDGRPYRLYRRTLLALLARPLVTVAGAVLLLLGSFQLLRFVPQIFFPANDKPVMYAELSYPVGTPLERTRAAIEELDGFIATEMRAEVGADGAVTRHGITSWASFAGSGPPRFYLSLSQEPPSPEYSYLLMDTTDRWRMESEFIPRLEAFCRERFPDATFLAAPLALGPPVQAPIQVRISGREADQVFDIVESVKTRLTETPGTRDIGDDWGPRAKKLFVRIDQARAQRAGLTNEDVAISLQTVLSGITITDYREEDEIIPVVLRSVAADRQDLGKLETHNIYVQRTGRAVPLKQVADIEVVFQPASVLRRDRLKTVTVDAGLEPGYNAISVARQLQSWLEEESRGWPPGYRFEQGGEIESSAQAQASIGAKLPIAGLIIVLLLVAQFDSLRRPAIIVLTIPLGLVGVILGLLVTQQPFGFMALLGVISLAGIVINNAIVLIDRIGLEIGVNGLEPRRAIVEAGQRRLRPILLTTATTVGGLVPLWLGGGPLFEPLAVAILFGLLFATLLTLGIVPVLYALFFRVRFAGFRYGDASQA